MMNRSELKEFFKNKTFEKEVRAEIEELIRVTDKFKNKATSIFYLEDLMNRIRLTADEKISYKHRLSIKLEH